MKRVPDVVEGDGDDTRWALETANTLFLNGDEREALRWVRRAAEAAAEAGHDARALELAKSVSELRERLDIPRTVPPPAEPDAQVVAVDPVPKAGRVPVGAQTLPTGGASPAVPIAGGGELTQQVAPAAAAPAAAASLRDSESMRSSGASPGKSESEPPGELVVTVVNSDDAVPKRASFVGHRAVRVAILPAVGERQEFVVRPLASGEVAPQEATVGLLVSFEPGVSPLPE